MPYLFEPLKLRDITFRNRIGISPMCQYSSTNGLANEWHLVHLGSRAVGGAGIVFTEAAAVEARGRISPQDLGIWSDEHVEPLARVTRFVAQHGAVPGIQLAHAGRKASTRRPWDGGGQMPESEGGWRAVGPSAVAFDKLPTPIELSLDQIRQVQNAFVEATRRSLAAGFQIIELHAAHGYLAHSFYSPLSNRRADQYGGSFDNRVRFVVETAAAMRRAWPEKLPMSARLSCSDWIDGGWTIEDSIELAKRLRAEGVDVIDCSSGGVAPGAAIAVGPGYQVPFAEAIRKHANIATAAVGLITEPAHADEVIRNGRADLVFVARQSLNDPNWPIHAAIALRHKELAPIPSQYLRAF
jgi:2,4-dienoyl-CoA reductase-like NADH-dependent reductase (Old Yellow Enzyme family)